MMAFTKKEKYNNIPIEIDYKVSLILFLKMDQEIMDICFHFINQQTKYYRKN